jgi:uncharacterized protein (TIGR02217 family)
MAFHDVRLPETYSENSEFGPGFNTVIAELKSGAEVRTQFWPVARREFNVTKGIDTLDKLITLKNFYLARQGATYAFRVKDWSDYATNPTGVLHRSTDTPVSNLNEVLVAVPGSTTKFQVVKRYTSGPTTVLRYLTHLVAGTLVVSVAGSSVTSGWSVDLLKGVITFTTAPVGEVRAGCEFDVPCRFSRDADRLFPIALKAAGNAALPAITVQEVVEQDEFQQEAFYGGSIAHGSMGGADVSVNLAHGLLQQFSPGVTGLAAILPPTTNLPTGGPLVVIFNSGSQSLAVEDDAGNNVTTITAGTGKRIYLGLNASLLKSWYAI